MTESFRVWRVKMSNGEYHYASEPKITPGTWVRKDHPEFLRRMGELGYSCLDEIPTTDDYATHTCQRCGHLGVELHHTAPKEIFGKEDAASFPLVELCPACHTHWHHTVWRWAGK
jgi:hypothetical protein